MLVLGIDPASVKCGYGIVRVEGQSISYVECGVLQVRAAVSKWARIHEIASDLQTVLAVHHMGRGDRVGVESAFVPIKNFSGADTLAEARGACVFVCLNAGVTNVVSVAPSSVKKAITGSGRAEKEAVASVLATMFSLRTAMAPDASDALAVAVAVARGAGS